MSAGYVFIQEPLTTAFAISGGIVGTGLLARFALKSSKDPHLPETKFGLKLFFETVTLYIVWLGDMVMGKENRRYLPFLTVLFLYLLISNFIGLVPGITISTDQMHLNFGLAMVVFGLYNYWSIAKLGAKGFFEHLWGPIFALGFILFPIEVFSHIIRPISLSIRLFGNMTADHAVLATFNDLTGGSWYFFAALPFYFLGTIVCFMQAMVFTLLTMVYIRLGTELSH